MCQPLPVGQPTRAMADAWEIAGVIATIVSVVAVIVFGILGFRQSRRSLYTLNVSPQEAQTLLSSAIPSLDPRLMEILSQFIFVNRSGPFNTGLFSTVRNSVFLDVFSPATVPELRLTLAHALTKRVRAMARDTGRDPSCVAVPKEGNVLLAAECARQLALPLVVVRSGKSIRFGYPLEGLVTNGMTAVIIDDVLSDGEFIGRCADRLHEHGVKVFDAVFLVERTDNTARRTLERRQLQVYAVVVVHDDLLRALAAKHAVIRKPRSRRRKTTRDSEVR